MLMCQCVTTLISIKSRPIHIEFDLFFFLNSSVDEDGHHSPPESPIAHARKQQDYPPPYTAPQCSYLASLCTCTTCTYCPKAANHAISPKTAVPLVTKDGILPLFKFRLILQTIVFIIGMF